MNGPETFSAIAAELIDNQCCVVGWTDGRSSHHDVLFVLSPKKFGSLQGGLGGNGYMFVTLMRYGSFAFEVARTNDLHSNYVAEKLGEHNNVTTKALAELINGVLEKFRPIKSPDSI